MNFESTELLKWLWLGLGVFGLLALFERRKRRLVRRYADARLIGTMSSLNPGKRRWKHALIGAAICLTVLALANPRLPGKSVFVQSRGQDIIIAVDVSLSMLAQDILPSRLDKAKLELQDLVDKAKGDRVGIIAFAGEAYPQVPLTTDRSAVKLFLKTLSPNLIPVQGTMIGEAIRRTLRMYPEDGVGKVMVLLTDGEDQGSDPFGAAKEANKKGVRIYTIGIGTNKGEVIPLRSPAGKVEFKRDLKGKTVVSKLDEQALQKIAAETGGRYYRSRKGNLEIDRIYSDLSNLAEKETGSGWVVDYAPLYQWPLCFAILILCAELAVSERRRGA